MSKSKVKRCFFWKMIQKGYVLACILAILFASIGSSQALVTDTLGSAAVVTNTSMSMINTTWQLNSTPAAFAALVNGSSFPVNITAVGVINSTNDYNAITASVLANTSTLTNDISLASVSGAISGLASVNIQQNSQITAFSQVSNSSVTTNIVNPFGTSSVSVSGNSISAETGLNETSQTAQGKLNPAFDSSIAGTTTLQPGNPQLSGDAGMFVGSFQHNNVISSTVMGNPFAQISGTNSIALTTSGTLGSNLTLNADNNSISAAFTGNTAENLLSVETGGANSLTSSAGIANLQINSNYDYPTFAPNTSAVIAAGSSISASVQTNPLTSSTLSFDGNQLEASATGSVSKNQLSVANGLNVAADGAQTNSLNFTAGSETATTSGGLFLNNFQFNAIAPISALATGPTGAAALSIDSRGLISSVLTADGNSFEAIALGNDAYGSISVDGATSFNSAVAASNLQIVNLSPVAATATNGTLSVRIGTTSQTAIDNIIGSTVSVDENSISALAVANRDPLLVSIIGTTVTDGLIQTAGTTVNNGTQALASTAGISAISSQTAIGSNVSAANAGAAISLVAGFDTSGVTGPHILNSTLTQSGNSLVSMANLNEGLVAAGINANRIDASSSVASVQNANGSNATATTGGVISTEIFTKKIAPAGADPINNNNLSVLVEGNTIASAAGGNLNASVLDVNAANIMMATNVIDQNGASSLVLGLSSAAATDQTLAEMSVLTDQRLINGDISAQTGFIGDPARVYLLIHPAGFSISDSTFNVDDNQIMATAGGNLTSNSLNFSALSVDMSAAEAGAPSTAAGSNLAAMGAVQVIDPSSSVSATLLSVQGGTDEILGRINGGSVLTNINLSVDGNFVTAAATGNLAISVLKGSGKTLAQDAPGSLSGVLNIAALPTTALTIADTAVANAIIQDNAGSVSASLATNRNYQITAVTAASGTETVERSITDTVITADKNSASALATGSSADISASLSFQTLESSAATAVQQAQSGATTAIVGGAAGLPANLAGVTISAQTQINTNLINSTISASGNTAGAQAIGATSASSLAASADDTLRSGYSDTAVDGASAQFFTAGGTQTSGDYMLSVQQNISGATTALAENMSVIASGGRFAGGNVKADSNFLAAQATGGISQGPLDSKGLPTAATLSLTANDMTAGGNAENTVDAVLSSDQRLSAAVSATLAASNVTVSSVNLTIAATGTNNSEAISASKNTLQASGLGLGSTNALTTAATNSVAGDSSGARTVALDSDITAVSGSGWDRLIVSNQEIAAGGTVAVTSAATAVSASITGSIDPFDVVAGDINSDSIKVDSNNLLAQGTGASSSNLLSTTAGDAINSLSQAIVARQSTGGAVTSLNTNVATNLSVAGNSADSAASISGNQLAAKATGLSGFNSLSTNSVTSITDDAGLSTLTTLILSGQEMLPSSGVTATLSNSQARLQVTAFDANSPGNIDVSTLKVDNNSLLAQATGATSNNNLSTTAGAGISSVSQAIASLQDSAAPVLANNNVTSATLNVAGSSTTSSLSVSGNELAAAADGLISSNTLSQKSSVSIIDDGALIPSGILSVQNLADTASVQVGLTQSQAALSVTGNVDDSALKVDNNKLLAQANGASSSNKFSASASTTIDSVFQGIVALQTSDALVAATNTTTAATLNIGGGSTNSGLSVSGNELAATAAGLNGSNSISMSSDVSIIDNRLFPPNAIVSIQGLADTASATATLAGSMANLSVTGSVIGSTLNVDNNFQQALAKGANNTNTLSVESGSFGATIPESISLAIYASQDSEAPISATNSGASNYLTIGGAASGNSLVLSGDGISASAINLTGANSLTAKAVTSNIGDTSTLSYVSATPTPATSADRTILSAQNVASTSNGDVSAAVNTMPIMSLSVAGGLSGNSTAYLNSNSIASDATVAANTNTLTNSANTLLTSSALIGSVQISAADSTAVTDLTDPTGGSDNGGLFIDIGTGTSNATVSMNENQVTASATDLTATNILSVTAGSIQGATPPALGSITASAPGTPAVISHNLSSALSAISSEQTTCPNCVVSASVLSPNLFVDLTGTVINSAVHQNSNLIQASSTSASVTNTLNQLADTSMSDAPALIAASQVVGGTSTATVTLALISPFIDGNVSASNLTADNNTIQSIATGGAMKNYIDPGAGTSIFAQINQPDPTVTTASSNFMGSYGLVSRQTSTAAVTATVDEESAGVYNIIAGDIIGNSAVSASDNIIRAQAANLTADNSLVTAAATALTGVTSGVLSYQNVAAATSATVTAAQVHLEGGNLTGVANADGNWLVAIATGGNSTNDLSVSGMSVSGAPVGGLSSLATSIAAGPALSAISGSESLASLLNVQSLTGSVTATMDAIDAGQGVLASFGAATDGVVTGSLSMNNNIVAAEASGLVANNTLALTSKTLIDGGSIALGSVQSGTANITASVTGVGSSTGFSLTATGALTGTATVDNNTIQADATANKAINSLSAKAATAINLGSETTTTAALTDISAGTAGLALQNLQQGTGAVTASIITAGVNTAITNVITGPLNGTASVDNNTVLAQARGQVAQNSLALNAGTSLNASASLANVQTNGGPIGATITNGDISLTTTTVTGTTSLSGNKVQASSTANLALNSMDIAGTLAASTGGSAGPLTATADYVALNTQSNTAAVASSVSGYTMRLADTVSTTGTASVNNNAILADATGNSSTNTFTISPKAGSNTTDFAFTGYQSNTGAISSSISGASISLTSAGGAGTFSATGNKIGATSIGNSSISSIKSGK